MWEISDKNGKRLREIAKDVDTRKLAIQTAKEAYDKVKDHESEEIKKLEAEEAVLVQQIADEFWATDDRDEGTKGQKTLSSLKLKEIVTTDYIYPAKKKIADLVADLKELGLKKFIRVKEEVDKDKIKKDATPAELAKIGIKTKLKRTVHVELI